MPPHPEPQAAPATAAREALVTFYAHQGLPPDGGRASSNWWCGTARWRIRLPNFGWRRRALPVHDLHHVLTGYPCSPVGEFEMAAWEFAAGRYPHPMATAFCLPLVGFGALLDPRRTFAAFVRGRSSKTLYARGLAPEVMGASVAQLQAELLPRHVPAARPRDAVAFLLLAAGAIAWTLSPLALVALLVWYL